ncbi:hypothetical protein ABEB36_008832 [Hypothenemus hampei]|uniref:Uncharacterized protein n=1 Tax=Hypothenemus hampei TaxID=57062 RepID=A0ABD1EQC7_HYPHA
MDPGAGTSYLTVVEKQIIVNVFKKVIIDDPTDKTVYIVAEITSVLGVTKSTVYRTIKKYKCTQMVRPFDHKGCRPALVKNFDENMKIAITQIVHSFSIEMKFPL